MNNQLIFPHGVEKIESLLCSPQKLEELRQECYHYPSISLSPTQLCDLELLLNGAFSPLKGYVTRKDYMSILSDMRLSDGTLWPIPITLDVSEAFAKSIGIASKISLKDAEGKVVAVLHAEDIWSPDRLTEAELVYGTTDTMHPGVHKLINGSHSWYIGGKIEGVQEIVHYDFRNLRKTPEQIRAHFLESRQFQVVGFQTRNPIHRAHKEITSLAAQEIGGNLLLHPVVAYTKHGDIDYYIRVKCYRAVLQEYQELNHVTLALLSLAMRFAGPREALLHGIIRQNYGCSHFIVGRDHASPGKDKEGKPFYDPYEAQDLFRKYQSDLGIQMISFPEMVYSKKRGIYMPANELAAEDEPCTLAGNKLRELLSHGKDVPEWFTYPGVLEQLRYAYPPRKERGFTVFFTGLSGAGKSTLARILQAKLLEFDNRPVTLLDGDVVRKYLSSELGFSHAHRNLNILRIGFVAREITKNRGIAICAPIAPYQAIRKEVQKSISEVGGFILIHVATPLETCEERDIKGLYAKARKGKIEHFTGISDPYEAPEEPDLTIDTTNQTPDESIQVILRYLYEQGYLPNLINGG